MNQWDERYNTDDYIYGLEANLFLQSKKDMFTQGMKVLLPADGEGRNGVYLAQLGCDITSVDFSQKGMDKAQRLARQHNVSITTECADLNDWDWPEEEYDAVVATFLHLLPEIRVPMHQRYVRALKPGGFILLEAYRPEHAEYREKYGSVGGGPNPQTMFTSALLAEDFKELDKLILEERDDILSEGEFHKGKSALVDAIYKKPL